MSERVSPSQINSQELVFKQVMSIPVYMYCMGDTLLILLIYPGTTCSVLRYDPINYMYGPLIIRHLCKHAKDVVRVIGNYYIENGLTIHYLCMYYTPQN